MKRVNYAMKGENREGNGAYLTIRTARIFSEEKNVYPLSLIFVIIAEGDRS